MNGFIISPSAHNVDSFAEQSRIEGGLMVGPRVTCLLCWICYIWRNAQ